MNFDELIEEAIKREGPDSEFTKYITSKQYKISLKILGERIKQQLTQKQAAQKAGISYEQYHNMEWGNLKYSEQQYIDVWKKMTE